MSLHLDSNVAIEILNGRRSDYRDRMRLLRASGERPVLSSIVVFELWFGVAGSKRFAENASAFRQLLTQVDVLPFTSDVAIAAGEIRATLEAAGTPIGPYDLLIAAHAVRGGATLVTANTREFARVPSLTIIDWSA
jgi:tRNA(fMet)-specific endonuclease VapC